MGLLSLDIILLHVRVRWFLTYILYSSLCSWLFFVLIIIFPPSNPLRPHIPVLVIVSNRLHIIISGSAVFKRHEHDGHGAAAIYT